MSKSDEYRKLAAACFEAAGLVSLRTDRDQLRTWGQRWNQLAEAEEESSRAEDKSGEGESAADQVPKRP